MHPLIRHFCSFVEKNQLFHPTDEVLISCSAGVDSLLLLNLITHIHPLQKITVVHFNHNTRPECRQENILVEQQAKKLGVCFLSFNLKMSSTDFENQARIARYKRLNQLNGDKILLAQHIDDSFEWSLMQQLRSSELSSSIGIPLAHGKIVRPFMCFSKHQIYQLARFMKISFLEDKSNNDQHYLRNYIRHTLVPHIKERFPNYLAHYVARSTALAMRLELLHLEQARGVVYHYKDFSTVHVSKDATDFSGWIPDLSKIIQSYSSKHRGSLQRQLLKLSKMLEQKREGELSFSGGVRVIIEVNSLYICNKKHILHKDKRVDLIKLSGVQFESMFIKGELIAGVKVSGKYASLPVSAGRYLLRWKKCRDYGREQTVSLIGLPPSLADRKLKTMKIGRL